MNKVLEGLIKNGIPTWYAQFHAAVNNSDNIPETMFSSKSTQESRRIEMWSTPHFLVCKHKNKYFLVPMASVIFTHLIDEPEMPKVEIPRPIAPKVIAVKAPKQSPTEKTSN